jgi:DNA-binding NarL/FixJ family response regulator
MNKPISIVILEDQPMAMDGYLAKLKPARNIEVVAACHFGEDLEPVLDRIPVDVLLLDVQVPVNRDNPNPFPIWHTITRILTRYPDLVILVISMFDRPAIIDAAIDAGVSGYILKDDYEAYQNLATIIQMAASGGAYFSPQARQRWIQKRFSGNDLLSIRQLEALSLCAAYPEDSLKELSNRMGIAPSTVRNLLSRTYLKLGVNSRSGAVAKARQLGILIQEKI